MKKIQLILLLLLGSSYLAVDAQTGRDGPTDIAARLKTFSEQHITEKTHLHLDKPYYAAGDTIYFKAYVTMGNRTDLSKISGILHVDLINTANKVDQTLKLQLTDGLAWGDISLPDSLPAGNYRIRAYTQWMRNEGNYFVQNIPVASLPRTKVTESSAVRTKPVTGKPDLQFFPEGGALVAGIRSKVAFKALASNGLGIDFKGSVADDKGTIVSQVAPSHLGMGYFYLEPQEGKTYTADITYTDGSTAKVNLPAAMPKGITLSVNNDSLSKASVRIEASKAYYQENKNKDYTLLIYSGGVAITVNCKLDEAVIPLDIIKKRLHSGVTRLTLFSPSSEPLCERLIFVQKYDQLNLAVNSDKASYGSRDKVNLKINAKTRADEATVGHFSVSVIDESKVPSDENAANTIVSDLLLTSDLKGYIEQPNYYFTNITSTTQADLDLVMMTHGYRKFDWKPLLDNSYPPMAWQPEKYLQISGTAKNLFGKPLQNGTVSLISHHGGGFAIANTGDDGRFSFNGLVFADNDKFILQAVNAKGGNTTRLVYDKDSPGPLVSRPVGVKNEDVNQSLPAYVDNAKLQQDEIAKYGTINGRMLKDVNIRGKRVITYPTATNSLVSPEFADQVILPDQMAKGGFFSDRIQGALHGIYITKGIGVKGSYATIGGTNTGVRMRVLLDGIDTDGDLDEINGDDVESVEVLRSAGTVGAYSGFAGSVGINQAVNYSSVINLASNSREQQTSFGSNSSGFAGATGFNQGGTNGILIINTNKNKGVQASSIASIGILPISPKGFYKAREFYSPQYDNPALKSGRPDLRTTIYWKPELVTDQSGNATLNYFNADKHGTYRVTIEGIDEKGNIGSQTYRYKVE